MATSQTTVIECPIHPDVHDRVAVPLAANDSPPGSPQSRQSLGCGTSLPPSGSRPSTAAGRQPVGKMIDGVVRKDLVLVDEHEFAPWATPALDSDQQADLVGVQGPDDTDGNVSISAWPVVVGRPARPYPGSTGRRRLANARRPQFSSAGSSGSLPRAAGRAQGWISASSARPAQSRARRQHRRNCSATQPRPRNPRSTALRRHALRCGVWGRASCSGHR